MKQVLILSSSARKGGNSDTLCDQFAKGAKESGHKVEKVFLADQNIGFCTGCGVCNDTHQCVQKDDMKKILDQMVDADVIVMATPIYFYAMSGRMKNLIDRTVPRYTEISNKEFYFILTAADPQKENFQRALEGSSGLRKTVWMGQKKPAFYMGQVYGIRGKSNIPQLIPRPMKWERKCDRNEENLQLKKQKISRTI